MPTYEVTYWSIAARADLIRCMLHVAGAQYKNTFVTDEGWLDVKPNQRYGHLPKLTVHFDDGTRKTLWESTAIEAYLAEVLDLVPSQDPLSRAECAAHRASLKELRETIWSNIGLMSTLPLEARITAHQTYRDTIIGDALVFHEGVIRRPYYFGERISWADLALYLIVVLVKEIYGTESPATAVRFPKIMKLVETCEAGSPGHYLKAYRTFEGSPKLFWSETECKYLAG